MTQHLIGIATEIGMIDIAMMIVIAKVTAEDVIVITKIVNMATANAIVMIMHTSEILYVLQ